MTYSRLAITPPKDQIEEFKRKRTDKITIMGFALRLKIPLRIESIWRVDYDSEEIYFVTAFMYTLYEKSPLSSLEIPDRHKRAVRKIGSTLFEKKRFDGLVLFEMSDPSVAYSARADGRTQLFAEVDDAQLWMLFNESDKETQKITKVNEEMRCVVQKNSIMIRSEILNSMIQASRGVEAITHLRKALERGCNPDVLERIWRDAHGVEDVPETLKSILNGDKEKKKT